MTFLFTDLEGSTRLWEEHPEAMRDALARHDDILRVAVESNDGQVVKTTGDGVHAAFATAHDAVWAAVDAQRAIGDEPWEKTGPLRVRMGIHTGEAEHRDGDYYGTAVNRAARLMSTAHGGQVLVSLTTAGLLRDAGAEGIGLLELGEHRLRDLARAESLFQLLSPGLDRAFPPPRTLDAFPTNLPLQPTTFLGRSRELAELVDVLGEHRLVTLTGVGGVGKTRLALQAAAEVLPRFRDGAWLVELAAVADPDSVADTIASVLDVPDAPGIPRDHAIVEDLRRRSLLLVLDNCEHVLERGATVAGAIGRHCPDVTVLATSREGLALPGERIIAVPALAVPDAHATRDDAAHAAAVRLFLDRAEAVRSDFVLSDENLEGVVNVCRRLDGVPLAIELAAARVASLSPAQIAERLDARFRLLTAGRRTVVERHQTLRAAIDWSYDLLAAEERVALNRLAVFAGGCTLAAAEAVIGGDPLDPIDVLDLLARLVGQSLVIADDQGTEQRYRLLETIRQYAAERLGDADDVTLTRERHARYFRDLVRVIAPGFSGPDEAASLAVLELERENVRSAITWFVDTDDAGAALGLVIDLMWPMITDPSEGFSAFAVLALEAPSASSHRLWPAVVALSAEYAVRSGELDEGVARVRMAVEASNAPPDDTYPLLKFMELRTELVGGNIDGALVLARERLGDHWNHGEAVLASWGLATVGAALILAGDAHEGEAIAADALALARGTGNPSAIGLALSVYGWVMRDREPDRARSMFLEILDLGEASGRLPMMYAWGNLFALGAAGGATGECFDWGRRIAATLPRIQERSAICAVLAHLAVGFAALGRFDAAAVLCGAAEAASPQVLAPGFGLDRVREEAEMALGRVRHAQCREEGLAIDKDALTAYVASELDAVAAGLEAGAR